MKGKNSMAMLLAIGTVCSLLMLPGCKGKEKGKETSLIATEDTTKLPENTIVPTPTQTPEVKNTYKAGILTDTDYKSEYIGVEFKSNDKYHLATREQMQEIYGASAKIAYDDKGEQASELSNDKLTYEMMAMTSKGSPNVNIAVQASFIPDMSEIDYIAALEKQLQNVPSMNLTMGSSKVEDFCGEHYTTVSAKVTVNGIESLEKYYIRKKEDNFIVMMVTGQKGAENEMKDILTCFKHIKA